jgi:lysophospholipase L1-like esterase
MEYWIYDGVHPTAAGHRLIAEAWLQAIRKGGQLR